MRNKLFLVILISIPISIEIQFQCPRAQQWNTRAILYCQSNLVYVCLWNSFELDYNEACIGPIEESGGYRIVQNINGNRDVEKCPPEYYQPENINFRTTQGDNCLYGKSLCSEVGQLIHSNGSSTADRTCRCDYTTGYAFISTERKNTFYCVASEEDCACYSKECDEDKILSPDYQCITREENKTQFNRSDVHVIHKNSATESRSVDTEHISRIFYKSGTVIKDNFCLSYQERWNHVAAGIVTALCIMMVIICWKLEDVYICCEKRGAFHFICAYAIECPDDLMECLEGENCTIKCVVSKGPAKWFKDDNSYITTETNIIDVNKKSYSVYTATIKNMRKENQGIYQLKTGNYIICETELRFKSQFRSDLKVVSAKCIEGYTVELQCKTNGCNCTVTWQHDGVEINEPKRIVIENQEDKHKLTIKDATVADSGKYTICHGNAVRNLDVKIKAFIKTHLVDTVIMEGLDVILKCEIEDEEEKNIACVEWLKNGIKFVGSDNIKLESEGTVYKLIIVSTELDHHNGRYEIVINQKYESAADLNVKSLPIEIKQMPKINREAFLSAARNGTTPNHSIRVMIVGKREAGKTCLLRRMLEKNIDGVDSTDCLNIEIRKCQIDVQSGNWQFSAYCWHSNGY